MDQEPYNIDDSRCGVVLNALRERFRARDWKLILAHVRSNHVHIVVDARCGRRG